MADGAPREEVRFEGVSVSHGVGMGPVFPLAESFPLDVPACVIDAADVPREVERLGAAITAAKRDLRELREEVKAKVGEHDSRIFTVHLEVIEDPSLHKQIGKSVSEDLLTAEAAVSKVIQRFCEAFEQLDDDFARERAADVRDVGRRLMQNLAESQLVSAAAPEQPYVVVTKELMPSDAARLDRRRIAGIVTEVGGKASHAAILARALGIPAVTGIRAIDTLVERSGATAIVDGRDGIVVLDPTPATIETFVGTAERIDRMRKELSSKPGLPAVTKDGTSVEIYLNVENPGDLLPTAMEGLAGIGLYRTEFIYLERSSFPSEDEQFEVYKKVLERCGNAEVVFRTIDIGGDKKLPYFRVGNEDNPALGWRGYRISDEWPDMFIAQVRALLRASAFGNVRIMLPMITTVEEVRRAAAIVVDVKADLARRKIATAETVPLGIMVEVPAAAISIDNMLRECDFVSIGSNDLIQYVLAADRNNARVSAISQPLNPSVLRTVKNVIKAAQTANKPVSLCGEMAGSYYCTLVLLGMGLRKFSMARHYAQGVGRLIQAVTIQEAEQVARRVLAFATTNEVRAFLSARTKEVFRGIGVEIED
jgi:phosphoenolpyruvate-protein phosphotransferase (PTS system enzyme I)